MSAGTEDDTYLALKRIPLAQLEEQKLASLADFCRRMIETQVYENYINDREYRRQEFYRKWLPFIGRIDNISIHTSIRVLDNLEQDTTAALFSGTGWTAAEYITELTKITEQTFHKKCLRNRMWEWIQAAAAMSSGALSGLVFFVFTPSFWFYIPIAVIIGIATGFSMIWIKNKVYEKDL